MFIRSKVVGGKTYYLVAEGVRVDGKVKQRSIASLGSCDTVGGALDWQRKRLKVYRKFLTRWSNFQDPAPSLAAQLASKRRAAALVEQKIELLSTLLHLDAERETADTTANVVSNTRPLDSALVDAMTATINHAERRIGRPFTDSEVGFTVSLMEDGFIDTTICDVVPTERFGDAEFWSIALQALADLITREYEAWPQDCRGVFLSKLHGIAHRLEHGSDDPFCDS